ncbi:MAG: hypothetical protein ABIZ18_15755, partial [Caldimonas sp.]
TTSRSTAVSIQAERRLRHHSAPRRTDHRIGTAQPMLISEFFFDQGLDIERCLINVRMVLSYTFE